MADVNAWQQDANGYFIDMEQTERKDYSHDWQDWLAPADTLANVVWTIDANITKVAQAIDGKFSQVELLASGQRGEYPCSAKMTSGSGKVEIVRFRVVVK